MTQYSKEKHRFSLIRSLRLMVMIFALFIGQKIMLEYSLGMPASTLELVLGVVKPPLPSPPVIPKIELEFPPTDFLQKVDYLFSLSYCSKELKALVKACDYMEVRNRVITIIDDDNPDGLDLADIADIFDFAISGWNYVDDPVTDDHIFPASETIQHLKGDCDDFAVLLSACLSAIGGNARINFVFNEYAGHAYAEICIGQADIEDVLYYIRRRYDLPANARLYYEVDSRGNAWLPLDWATSYPGGKPFAYTEGYQFYILQNHCLEL